MKMHHQEICNDTWQKLINLDFDMRTLYFPGIELTNPFGQQKD